MSKKHIKFGFIFLVVGGYIMLQPSFKVFAVNELSQAQIYDHKPYSRIKAHIGLKSQNRINFGNYGIREIIGDDSLYQLIHDSYGYNIFIIPKVSVGEVIDITIVSNSNKVQDLSLKIVDDYGQTIVINTRSLADEK